jgi:hypothetical protein
MVSVTKHPDGSTDVDMSDDEIAVRFEMEIQGHVPTCAMDELEKEVERRLGENAANVSISGVYTDRERVVRHPSVPDKIISNIEGVYVLEKEDD